MDVLELGTAPKPLRIRLGRGAWSASIRIKASSPLTEWPAGAAISLIITDVRTGTAWTATTALDGRRATFSLTGTQVAAIPDGADAVITYAEPGSPAVVWYDGAAVKP